MYTQCPHCWSILAIGADAIRAGRGRARCGYCFEEFDVLDRLRDTLGELVPEVAGCGSDSDLCAGNDWRPEAPASDVSRAVVQACDGPAAQELTNLTEPPVEANDGFPQILREDLEAAATGRPGTTRRLVFAGGSLLLLILLGAQWMWFSSEALSERYPAFVPMLTSFCQYSGCELPQRRDPTQIQMISRDVRVHPDYEGALRVVATMVNRLPYVQPYPQMRFTLFNVNGEVIVGRTFRPDEYLASEINLTAGMPSQEPVQIVLDLLALEEAAVSFEFRFL